MDSSVLIQALLPPPATGWRFSASSTQRKSVRESLSKQYISPREKLLPSSRDLLLAYSMERFELKPQRLGSMTSAKRICPIKYLNINAFIYPFGDGLRCVDSWCAMWSTLRCEISAGKSASAIQFEHVKFFGVLFVFRSVAELHHSVPCLDLATPANSRVFLENSIAVLFRTGESSAIPENLYMQL